MFTNSGWFKSDCKFCLEVGLKSKEGRNVQVRYAGDRCGSQMLKPTQTLCYGPQKLTDTDGVSYTR